MTRSASLDDRLIAEIDARRDDLVALTQALVRIPTVNPPGRDYRAICELLEARLAPSGFACTLVRAEGAPGDSDRWPRWNIVARREGPRPGETVHFNSHIDVVETGHGWTVDPFGGEVGRPGLRPGDLRHEGRPRGLHRRGRGVPRRLPRFRGRRGDLRHGGRGIGRLRRRRLSCGKGDGFRPTACSTSSSPSR
jgi:hypothetical protein